MANLQKKTTVVVVPPLIITISLANQFPSIKSANIIQKQLMASETGSSATVADQPQSATPPTSDPQTCNEKMLEANTEGGDSKSTPKDKSEGTEVQLASDGNGEKSLEFAAELMEKGAKALKESGFGEAADCFSRALEIQVQHHGELAFECMSAYYQYGRTLLYKAQEEADPLGSVPKKDDEYKQETDKDGSVKSVVGDSSNVSNAGDAGDDGSSSRQEEAANDAAVVKDQEEDNGDSGDEDLVDADADEDESDLDLAWKMLDIARVIADKHSGDIIDKVDILSALAEVSLEREDIETSLNDYRNALSILERLVEPDSRQIAELNFRICLCLEIGSKSEEAIPYCEKSISVCKSRLQRLANEVKLTSEPAASSATSDLDEGVQQSPTESLTDKSVADKKAEIETLSDLAGELEKKLEDLHQQVRNPKSILPEILAMVSAKAKGADKGVDPAITSSTRMATADSVGGFDSPTVSTAHSNGASGVTHLGVVGRGVKRVLTNKESSDPSPAKKPALDALPDKGDGDGKST